MSQLFNSEDVVVEQYELSPQNYYRFISYAIKHFKAEFVFIRLVGSRGGTVKVSEDVRGKKLVAIRCRDGLKIIINNQEIFLFKTTSVKKNDRLSGKCWAIAYYRVDDDGKMHFASTGYPNLQEFYTGPDDPRLPKVKQTIFRSVNDDHLIEITFSGKIPIRCSNKLVSRIPGWYYWVIDYNFC